MDIERLREFTVLAQQLNFTAAAQRCYVSQSVLSRHISALDAELDVKLFVRSQQRVRLTEHGRVLYDGARDMLSLYDETLASMRDVSRCDTETLKVGYQFGVAHAFLSAASSVFAQREKRVMLQTFQGEYGDLENMLGNDGIDVAITMTFSPPNSSWYASSTIFEDTHGALVPAGSHLAQHDSLVLADLEGETVLLPSRERHNAYAEFLGHAVRDAVPDMDVLTVITDSNDYPVQVKANGYVSIIPTHLLAFQDLDGVGFVPLQDESLSFDVRIVWKHSNESRAVLSFVEAIKSVVETMSQDELRNI